MAMVTHVHHVGVNFASLGPICGLGRELPYSLSVCGHGAQLAGHLMVDWNDAHEAPRLKNLSFTECDCYLGPAPGPSFVLRSLSQHLEFHQIQKMKRTLNEVSRLKRFKNMNKCSIESKYDGDQLSHNNSTLYQTILMTFNNEIPSFYNKANQKSINGESHCFNVSVETKVPLLS